MNKGIWFDKDLLRSEAFRSLSKWSLLAYLDFLRRRKMHKLQRKKGRSDEWIIENNGAIVYPYLEAERKGINRRNFRNAIDELIEKGFLDINHSGSGGRKGDVSTYWIDDRWQDYETDKFRPPKNPRVKDARKGRGWGVIMGNEKMKKKLLAKRKKKSSVLKMTPKSEVSSVNNDTSNDISQEVWSVNCDTSIGSKKSLTI